MQNNIKKPIPRNSARLMLGRIYYTYKRYIYWMFGGFRFAKKTEHKLTNVCFFHETPLLRKLKDVDMYMQYNKITNLKIASNRLTYITLNPGETFSFWKLIKKPTKKKGYLDGMVLQNGTFKAGIGGGLCQLSNLIYWMTIHTPLTIIERHRHSYDVFPDSVRTQPFGSGATCYYNYGDLMIKNNTNITFQLIVEVTETHLKGWWRSNIPLDYKYVVYEREHIIKQEFWGGYSRHNTIYRKKYDLNNILLFDEFVVENHAIMMYSPLISEHN